MGVPRRIADIQPFAELAQGTTTVVYKGYQPSLDRFVLLKVLRPEYGRDDDLVQRFEEEARLIAKVQHPNVVAIHAYGRDGQQVYLATEFVEGQDLRRLLQRGPLPFELAVVVLLEAARGLTAAHDKGVLHRDLKPANILISDEGHVKITDFGLASLVPGGNRPTAEVRGTLAYLAPEQVRGEAPGPEADFFALGATFYEMLTGRRAFAGKTSSEMLDAILHHDPLAYLALHADIPREGHRICATLLAKAPSERYADGNVLIDDLEALQSEQRRRVGATALQAYVDDPARYRRRSAESVESDADGIRGQASPEPVVEGVGSEEERAHPRWPLVLAALGVAMLVGAGMVWIGTQGAEGQGPRSSSASEAETTTASLETTAQLSADAAFTLDSTHARDGGTAKERDSIRGREPASSEAQPEQKSTQQPSAAVQDGTPDRAAATRDESTPQGGHLRVICAPWAAVYVGGDSVGTVQPEGLFVLPVGMHQLSFRHPEFPTYDVPVEVRADTTTIAISLWTQVGRLMLRVHPWAEVLVDGVVQDTTPMLQHPLVLRPGDHLLTLRHPALGRYDTTISVTAGTATTLQFDLREQRER